MPVPIPRQRAIPAAESGQAQGAFSPGGPSGEATGGPAGAAPAPHAATTPVDSTTNLTLLVIEDDPAGSLSVPEMLDAAGKPIRIRTARNLTEAERLLTDDVHCILLDLALPAPGRAATESDDELTTLKHVLRLAPRHAVLALTASGDAERGAEAVRVGAQDYLFRDELDGRLLSRAIRYAVERKRSDKAERRLTESRLRAQENARLERGLLPTPLLEGSSLRFAARYRPGRSRALLGGDFYDTVRTPDGTVHAMIGDVCGHGPDEAALGVELRIAWRALTFAGLCGDELLSTLQQVLEHERENDEIFATLCTVDIAPDGRRAGLCLAGHPSPLISRPGRPAELLPYENGGPALGLLHGARWPRQQVELGGEWSLMLYTDGLIEGHIGEGKERLGQDGMVDLVRRRLAEGLTGEELLRATVNEVRDLNGGELTDDVAVLLLDRTP
ncbi:MULTISPECIES: PP2C family protein-serine/threonine phosphatase [Streptomyces]|uniref:SpoIIE family protein phosphatase n=1 Tax=Streptomyces mirabilis TaxID=68239 RepID=A0ABU3UR33_9ACTN|nr:MULTISPECIES: response regulator [Streptomyces]MCX5350209.1 SpoIIE family protein phosphatase [Streptomyces mirabilis]MDU8996375.1 SpoIIE family protein phosphatase [Streptomyces mirabilis]NMI59265.1 SpoIIE family protein phosphatase [Streptomyces sp. RLA2-12]QDN58527.1 SpoIIE family protein phosphatase [Streptomyces sp. S1D4-20]QDN68621.1 SpoIIE family protein phosphatase [Streptomyces sp. S1D4-14]